MTTSDLQNLLDEYDRSLLYTESLLEGLTPGQVAWRPEAESSAIGWHLGHQGAVSHFMLRNLTAAEPSIDTDIDALMDSATPEPDRGELPSLDRIHEYRNVVAERVRYRIRHRRWRDRLAQPMGEGTHRGRRSGPALLLDQVGDVLEDERSEPGEGDVAVAGLDAVLASADDQT